MTDHRESVYGWLILKVSMFTLIVPGTVVVLVPYLLIGNTPLDSIDNSGILLLAYGLLLPGIGLYIRSAYDFAFSGGGTPAPIDAPVKLVTNGPYRYTRNPMYVGVLSILSGEALASRHLSVLIYLGIVVVVFNLFVRYYEEPALRRKFGESYVRYCARVPRWVPVFTGHSSSDGSYM